MTPLRRLAVWVPMACCLGLGGARAVAAEPALLTPAAELRQQWSLADPAVARWQRLFGLGVDDVVREVHFLAEQEDRGLRFLASRLLYRGEPWLQRHERKLKPAVIDLRWREWDRTVKAAILRELRFRGQAALIPVYAVYLQQEARPSLLRSALLNIHRLAPEALRPVLAGLVDPRVAGGYAAAGVPVARAAALAFAIEHLDDYPAVVDRGVAHALRQGEPFERREASVLCRQAGHHPACLAAVVGDLLAARAGERFGEVDTIVLVNLLALATAADVAEHHSAIVAAALAAERMVACAAVAALLRHPQTLADRQITALRERLAVVRDVALRQSLLALLAQADADLVRRQVGPGSPWTAVSLHREALAAWPRRQVEAAAGSGRRGSQGVEAGPGPEGGGDDPEVEP